MRSLKYAHAFEVVKALPEPLLPLRRIAYNFWWTWNHETRSLFRDIGRDLWERVEHNPVELLNQLGEEDMERLAGDDVFLAQLRKCVTAFDAYLAAPNWFDRTYPGRRDDTLVAYFSAEFGLSEALPIYSGGLGVLAGDHLKAASDLGIPLVGVGLLYGRGYFRQTLSPDGWQQERYPQYDFHRLPLQMARADDGTPHRIRIELDGSSVLCQIWIAEVGRVRLLLLDSNLLENEASGQGITDTLYGGDSEMRLRQEIILGIGGYQALVKLGLRPTVCHMNEGHSALLVLERIRDAMTADGVDFRTARQATVAGNVFTTHTPVPAGFDVFEVELVERYLAGAAASLGIDKAKLLEMGQLAREGEPGKFNMAALAMSNSNSMNAVSKLHAETSREMFAARWPGAPFSEVPIEAVTNGVHTLTWLGRRATELFDRHLGPGWREDPSDPTVWERASQIPDREVWEMRENERGDLVRYCRKRLREQARHGSSGPVEMAYVNDVLDPRVLTIGFARRFATYKRAGLVFKDRERLKRILFHPDRPVQIVFAGKSHPRDDGGKRLIQEITEFIRNEDARKHIVFLEDYDMAVARRLIQGVDVWLNNPRRPMEASGTSGMKVVPNGGLNCSVLDGWWAEAYTRGVGWCIGDERINPDDAYQDWLDSSSLYHLIENEIAPMFYYRTDGGIPAAWIETVKRAWRELAPKFTTHRMVRDYATRAYMPATDAYMALHQDGYKSAKDALAWRDTVTESWDGVRILGVEDDAQKANPVGSEVKLRAKVALGKLTPDDVRVQALQGRVTSSRELTDLEVVTLKPAQQDGQAWWFEGYVECSEPGQRGYVVRVVPAHRLVSVQHELPLATYESSL